ncbi:MAG: hypothetical protein ACXWIU_09565 [Limisphaerales bacterium]
MDSQLVITTITRFGTILFIVFTISVFLHVYRYLMRLAAYTHARADALDLMANFSDADAKRFHQFAKALNAEQIDFGKTPNTPPEQIVELVKVIAQNAPK